MKKKILLSSVAIIGAAGAAIALKEKRKKNKRGLMISELRPTGLEQDIITVQSAIIPFIESTDRKKDASKLIENAIVMLDQLYSSEVSFDDVYKLITNEGSCLEVAVANYELQEDKNMKVLYYFNKEYIPGMFEEENASSVFKNTEQCRDAFSKFLKY